MTGEVVFDQFQVHQPYQPDQRILHVELLIKLRAEHLSGLWHAVMRLHRRRNLQEIRENQYVSLQILHHKSAKHFIQIKHLRVVQGRLLMRSTSRVPISIRMLIG